MSNEPTGIELKVTREKLLAHLKETGVSGITRQRIMLIVDELGVDGFATGDEMAWNMALRKARPETSVCLGKTGVQVMNDVARWIKEAKFQQKLDIIAERKAEEEKAAEEAKVREAAEAEERRLNPEFTVDELEAIVILMRQCHLDGVDLRGARGFLNTFKIYPKPGAAAMAKGE